MAKRLLHQLRVRTADLSRKRGKRKLVSPPVTDAGQTVTDVEHPPQPTPAVFAAEARERPKTQSYKRSPFWRWSLVWVSIVLILGGTGVVGALLLTTLPPPPDCEHMSPLTPDSEQLYCAQLAAQSGKLDRLVAAMQLVSGWGENHPLYPEAQKKMEEWSQALLAIARQKMNQGNLEAASAIVNKIPVNSPFYPEAQAKITDWQQDWKRGEQIANSVKDSMRAQDWLTASKKAHALLLMNIDYWRQKRFDELMNQMEMERQAWQKIQEARSLAQSNSPTDLDQAIALAGKVNPKTLARLQAQADRDKWSRALVQIAAERFKQKDFAGVVVVLQRIPLDSAVYEEAQDWIRLSQADYAAQHKQILAFLDAISAVRQIGKKSPLYPQAQAQLSVWQSHLQDQVQLEFASALASLDQPSTFQLAINQAQLIAPNRPGRVQAQTMIAYWHEEIQQIYDRATLAVARQLAKPGTIWSLKAAVSKAAQIKRTQPLRIEAQTAIAQWTNQIQTIEDQPVLDRAQDLAKKGELVAAVQVARQIFPGRVLYSQAKNAVDNWVAQIQIAEDQPILKAAGALADQGRLMEAIQMAAKISVGRPLYGKAQTAIASWQSKLDAAQAESDQPLPPAWTQAQPVESQPVESQSEERGRSKHERSKHHRVRHPLATEREVSSKKPSRDGEQQPIDTN